MAAPKRFAAIDALLFLHGSFISALCPIALIGILCNGRACQHLTLRAAIGLLMFLQRFPTIFTDPHVFPPLARLLQQRGRLRPLQTTTLWLGLIGAYCLAP